MRIRVTLPELITTAVIFIFAIALLVLTRGMPIMDEGSPGPRFFPLILAIAFAVLDLLYLLERFFSKHASNSAIIFPKVLKPYLYVGSAFVIVLLWERLGAVPTILITGLFQFRVIESLSWEKTIIASLVMSVFTYVLFQRVLGINLPAGLFTWLLVR
ncbi:MAG TPA: hypothetical protein DCQ16_00150 [Spirochaetaceae bacterium]|jgi:hypothetical protein|nr:MAG: Tripartite tricarboxylate transporter TctB family protein [Pelotomaculum sp. PtaB.Bin104]VBB40363.1 membrane hypothetical protein [uncultured Spirochaetota bacterium]HAP54399.1 hypothetical protein [Spirochaetaceae bacterium]HOI23655.1 tripartite tricarboxylate transporter TctB family protein [Spirochaetales bacterium]